MEKIIAEHHNELIAHPVYRSLKNIDDIRTFMEFHVFAVWDFMSLLKSIQNKVTCTSVPWKPSSYSAEVVRMINEIVLGEESDVDQFGEPCSHFELYLRAMEEVGANTAAIKDFLNTFNTELIPSGAREFVEFNLDLAMNGRIEEVAASFFYGREKLLPDVFREMVKVLKSENIECPTLLYYFERHIEVDGYSHGPLAMKCLKEICGNNETKTLRAQYAGVQSLRMRCKMWDATHKAILYKAKQHLYAVQ
ncbi:MAG: hypothetical protein CME63_13170 [Halobacteriovoraceae bacterium]|nr:hypothetical protein [Halobacteriovoraceae bacterium]